MKFKFLAALLVLSLTSLAQKKTANFGNGEKIEYEVTDFDGANFPRLMLNVGLTNGLDYFHPELGQASVSIFPILDIVAMPYLGSFSADDDVMIKIKGTYNTNYMVTENFKKQYYYGPVIGYTDVKFNPVLENFTQLSLGFGLTRWKHIEFNIGEYDRAMSGYYTLSLSGVKADYTDLVYTNELLGYTENKDESRYGLMLNYKAGNYAYKYFGLTLDLGVIALFGGDETKYIPKYGFALSFPLWYED